MSVSVVVPKNIYTGNGVLLSFAITFDFLSSTYVKVIKKNTTTKLETVLVNPTDYSVSGTNVLMVVAPTASEQVIIYRVSPRSQTTSYSTSGPFLAADHEQGLDKLEYQIQELEMAVNRAVKFSLGDQQAGLVGEIISPAVASYILAVNPTATGFIFASPASILGGAFIGALAAFGSTPNANGLTVATGSLNMEPASDTFPGGVSILAQSFAGVKTFVDNIIASANVTIAGFLRKSNESGISSFSGGGQASATQLTKDINRVTVVLASGDSVKLPSAVAGSEVTVINDGGNTLNIFPSSGESIDALGANVQYPLTIAVKNVTFVCPTVGTWRSKAGGGSSSPLTTKGDVWGFSTIDARIPVGSNNQGLIADSTQALGVRWASFINSITSSLTLAASGTIAISTTAFVQTFLVQGNSAAVTLSTTPFGGTPPPNGSIIMLIGNSDTNTVEIPFNDAANGCLMDGNAVLTRGQTAEFIYSTTLARYVRIR